MELYTHHSSMKNITANLVKYGLHLCAVHLVDAHYCSDPGKTSRHLTRYRSLWIQDVIN